MLQVNLGKTALSNANYLQGQQDSNLRPDCDLKKAIDNASATIDFLSKGGNPDKVVTKILSGSIPELQQYAMMQREVPEKAVGPLAMQCALMRMKDIATVAGALGCSDYDALCTILVDENNLLANELPQSNEIMSAQLQACIGYIMDKIISKHTAAGGSGTCAEALRAINNSTNYFTKANGPDYSSGPSYFDFADVNAFPIIDDGGAGITSSTDVYTPDPGPGSGGTGTGNPIVSAPVSIDPNAIGAVPGGIQNQPGTGNTTNGKGVLDFIDNVLGFVTDAAGNVAAAATTVGNAVQGTANNVSTNAMKAAIVKNLPLIIGVVVLLVVIVLIIVYAAKSKSK